MKKGCLVATHVGLENLGLFRLNIEMALKYEPKSEHYLLVVHGEELSREQIEGPARGFFKTVRLVKHDEWKGIARVPTKENFVWQLAARTIEADLEHRFKSWLWWEQDACPLKKGWVDDLFEEQRRSRKVFSGYVYQAQHLPVRFMDRCGIWPTAVSQHLVHSGALFAQGAPFDRVAGSDVIKSVNESDLVLVDQDADFDFEQIQVRRKEACLLRGTNGAQQEVFLGRQSIEKVKKHFSKDKYESFLEQTEYECGVFAFPYAEKTCYFNPSIVRNEGDEWGSAGGVFGEAVYREG